jgi:hypothetical protein
MRADSSSAFAASRSTAAAPRSDDSARSGRASLRATVTLTDTRLGSESGPSSGQSPIPDPNGDPIRGQRASQRVTTHPKWLAGPEVTRRQAQRGISAFGGAKNGGQGQN